MSRQICLDGGDWWCKPYVGEEWQMRRAYAPDTRDVHGWHPARVPGSVLADLVRAGEVPDPRVDRNSRLCEWVADRTWVYRRRILLDDPSGARVELHLEGIDHAADLFCNGERVGAHVGAFTPARFDVTDHVVPGDNVVAVVLAPAPDNQPQVGRTDLVRNGKSRMTYGWDFCPRLIHLGIWDRVRLEFPGPVRITDLFVRPHVAAGGATAQVRWEITVHAEQPRRGRVEVDLDRHGHTVASDAIDVDLAGGQQVLRGALDVADPQLWWPNGYGDQPLYRLRARFATPAGSDERATTVGIRQVELAPNEGAPAGARGYTFVVNGTRVYVQGWNWVPMDVHHGVEDPERLGHLLGLAARAGVNLLRVWGGGLIEKDDFYDRCDRLGIMVWQEFVLSSSGIASQPSRDPAYVAKTAADAEGIVPRRRNHPSLVLWCGGNELDGADGRPLDDSEPVVAALRDVVRRLDPDRAWLPTSPTGPDPTCTLEAIDRNPDGQHDVHGPWEHQGLTAQYTLANSATSLLHSEFGVEGLTNLATLEAFVSPPHRWPPDRSNPHWVHRGDWWINTPLVEEIFGPIDDLAILVRASQLLQADGLRYAVEANRRRQWRNSGSIPWQLNEPFPNAFCTSAVDYCGRPKAAYYAAARAYAPVHVSARLPTPAWEGYEDFEAQVWACSSTDALVAERLEAALVDAHGRRLHGEAWSVEVEAGQATCLTEIRWPLPSLDMGLFWLDLRLLDGAGALRSANRYLGTATSDLRSLRELPVTRLDVRWAAPGRVLTVRNAGEHVAVGVTAADDRSATAPGYVWFDTGHLTLLPGEEQPVTVGWLGVPEGDRRVSVSAWNSDGACVV